MRQPILFRMNWRFFATRKERPAWISLADTLFDGDRTYLDVRVRMLYGDGSVNGILNQYVVFTKIIDEQISLHGRTQKAVEETIRLCQQAGALEEYLTSHERQVVRIMTTLFSQEYVTKAYVAEAREEGRTEGRMDEKKETAFRMKALGSDNSFIASTLNAHYTSPAVIRAMYAAIEQMGFSGGNILEPSMGIGNFFGMLPESMRNSRLYGVELDSITGRIVQQPYPEAEITVAGFETTDQRDFYDLAVGNVPFGDYRVADKPYDRLGFSIHTEVSEEEPETRPSVLADLKTRADKITPSRSSDEEVTR